MKLLLMGNPNVGKSVVFNRLTGARVVYSNYPGSTVEYTRGFMPLGEERAEVVDVPGTYSLDAASSAEEVATDFLDKLDKNDTVINVVDATNLERSLNLTLQLASRGVRMVVALNMWDETKHTGIKIDVEKLSEILGVDCVPLVAITGVGAKELVEKLSDARPAKIKCASENRWSKVGEIVSAVQKVTHKHHTFLERLGDASVRPVSGIFIGIFVLGIAFTVIRYIGEGLITYVFDPLFQTLWQPVMRSLSNALGGEGFIHQILIGNVDKSGEWSFTESLGLLTTGLYVPLAQVLPYIVAFYLVLSILEDSGYLPRLAVLSDSLMHRVGLHGMGVIPMMLGFGCNVPGVLATRIMESKRERFIATTLMAICVPCVAQSAMIVALAGEHVVFVLSTMMITLLLVTIIIGRVMHKYVTGESPEILIDIPPYRIPYFRGLGRKVLMRVTHFLKDALVWVSVGILIMNLMTVIGLMTFIEAAARPVITGLLGLPEESVGGIVVGLLRKDVAVGMLAPVLLTKVQLAVISVVLTMYFPCAATFIVMLKELGPKDTARAILVMVVASLTTGAILNQVLTLAAG